MDEGRIGYEELDASLYEVRNHYYSIQDVDNFLSSMRLDKSNTQRFIYWMIALNLLPPKPDLWASTLFNFYNEYKRKMMSYMSHSMNSPLSVLSPKEANIIYADITRTIGWFKTMAHSFRIPTNFSNNAELHALRVFSIMSLDSLSFSYTQGYDRYLFVSYLVALNFCLQNNLHSGFAEAISFYLTRAWVNIVGLSTYLDNPLETEKMFNQMDKEIAKIVPETARLLAKSDHGSIHFALRWILLLFADEYDIYGLLFLWDQILYRKKDFQQFVRSLCLAHIKQIPLAVENEVMVEKIQGFKNWDSQLIINDALAIMNSRKLMMIKLRNYLIIILVVIFILMLIQRM